jgi:hypothetical protein
VIENVWIEIGDARHKIHAAHLPPVGTKMPVRLEYEGGEAVEVVVLGHDWSIDEPQMEKDNPRLRVVIRTRPVPPATRPGSAHDRAPAVAARPALATAGFRR